MLTTNLLPPQDKKMLRLEDWRKIILFSALSLSAIFLMGAALILPSFFPAWLSQNELERALVLEEEASARLEISQLNSRIAKIRAALSSIGKYAEESSRASQILEQFLGGEGTAGIKILNLAVKSGGALTITGEAATRRDLLNFEKMLRDNGKFQEIASPLSNIVRGTAINFRIQAKLKPIYSL